MINIVGTGSYLPKKILTNYDLEKIVETSDQWIVERTGIRERRIAENGLANSEMGMQAALKALSDAQINPEDIDLIVVATMTPDMLSPSTACLIQERIGAKKATCFDLNAACSGFLYALDVSKKFLESDQFGNALVIGAEKLSAIVDWKDRSTCILFGDGAGAAVLSKKKSGHKILGIFLGSDGSGADALKIPAGGSLMPPTHKTVDDRLHFMKMDGREVYKRAIDVMSKISLDSIANCGLTMEDVDLFIPHQANKRIIDAVAKKLSFPSEKVFINLDRYGNTSAASIILALDEAKVQGQIQKGDHILIVVFGAGFTWGGCVVEW
jgi:3-oxoacyl-[acyl-carrier-protein] synthase-3